MKFRVAATMYSVKLSKSLHIDGKKHDGAFDWQHSTIWIDADVPPRRRLAILLHELRHAWQQDLGRPADEEGDANNIASFAADVWRQLERQGGEHALMRMTLDGVVDQGMDLDAPAEPRDALCPSCGGKLNRPTRTATPEFVAKQNRLLARRSADCEFCGHEVSWLETVTGAGVPTGHVIGEASVGRCASAH